MSSSISGFPEAIFFKSTMQERMCGIDGERGMLFDRKVKYADAARRVATFALHQRRVFDEPHAVAQRADSR